jgi:DNA helicase II / ATP-dependent DNA helicase PcrA
MCRCADVLMLNPEQQRAVEHCSGPLLILAGAGSGKTRVLTHRIAHLISAHNVAPHNILAVTFTNKAARELRNRVEQLVGGTRGMWVTTFHSAGLRLLRQEAPHVDRARDFVIYDDADQQKIVRDVLLELNLDEKRIQPRSVVTHISRIKDQLLGPDAFHTVAPGTYGERLAQIFALYEERLHRARAVDFADLIRLPVELFLAHPEILARYQRRFQYVLIDEYQDTNHAQYRLVRLLTDTHGNICCVGDVDQSIYGWRGADIQNILSFERDYPETTVIKLEQNYRSTQTILDASNAVIAQNRSRRPKNLWCDSGPGDRITVQPHDNDLEEAAWLARGCYEVRTTGGQYNDVAVFYRTNAQSRVIEEAFRRAGIPYTIYGGVRFYERKEVKDLLSYLRLVVNPHDGVGLTRVLNVPPRGIGQTTINRLLATATRERKSVYEVLEHIEQYPIFKAAACKRLREFGTLLGQLQEAAAVGLDLLWDRLLEVTGYTAWLAHDERGDDRLANIEELGRALLENPYDAEANETPLQQFLDQVALVSDIDRLNGEGGTVSMMTLHLAKGLEFPTVFLVGMEEGLFPHARSLDDEEGIEEERRLCYVGMTRAEKRLSMSYARRRRLHGREQYSMASRFLEEIPEEFVKALPVLSSQFALGGGEVPSGYAENRQRKTDHDVVHDDFDQRDSGEMMDNLRPGLRVRHPVFGAGIVHETAGAGERTKVTVEFDQAGRRTLMLAYANLTGVG